MSKTLKNIIMVFTLLCVIFLIVFCVELFLINRGSNTTPETVISGDDPEEPPENLLTFDDPVSDDPFDLNDPVTDPIDDDRSGPAVTPPLTATRQSFLLSAGIAELVFYVDMELFERSDLGDGWFYSYLAEGNAGIEISLVYVHPQGGINTLANDFLHNYLDGGDTIVEGERSIGRSPIRGTFVTGENGGETFSAWLRSLSDFDLDSLALVVVVNYEDITQSDVIFTILDTMYINMLNTTTDD